MDFACLFLADNQTKVPPSLIGYAHVGKLVYITEEREILINPCHDNTVDVDDAGIKKLAETGAVSERGPQDDDDDDGKREIGLRQRNDKYDKLIKLAPGPLKDHMPDFYLEPLVRLAEKN